MRISEETWGRIIGGGLMTGLVVFLLFILIAAINAVYFNDPSIKATSLDGSRLAYSVCPGQRLEVHNRVEVTRPMLLFSYFSVMDARRNYNINGTQVANGARLHPYASTFNQTLFWAVPDLAPGTYARVLAFRGTDGRENSIFVSTLFEIGRNC